MRTIASMDTKQPGLNQFFTNVLDNNISDYLSKAYPFVENHLEEWELNFDADLEVTNHVLRVRIQDGSIAQYKEDVLDVCHCQHQDGGWGTTRDDQNSKIRSTSFCVQMLLRANRVLKNDLIQHHILKGLAYIVAAQNTNGSWTDPTWHFLDATSTSVGTLLFAVNEPFVNEQYRKTLDKGMNFIVSTRNENGLWYYKPTGSPVTITAHLLQKCATYYGSLDIHDQSIRNLIELQEECGSWDKGNTDHTCDAVRAMMLTSSRSKNENITKEVCVSTCKAVQWLIEVSNEIDGGLGDRLGKPANVERTCDGIDTMLKLRQFIKDFSEMLEFWN